MKEITLKAHLKSIASLGGIARSKKLSKFRRLEISRKANEAKKIKKEVFGYQGVNHPTLIED